MKCFLQVSLIAFICGLLPAQDQDKHGHKCIHVDDAKAKALIEQYQKIFKEAKELMIYEGLPHPDKEEAALKAESQRNDVVNLPPWDEKFYTPAIKATNADALIEFLSTPANIRISKPHKCGFHSDYCIEFKHGGATYRIMICFGCVELFVIKDKEERGRIFSFNKEPLEELLSVYDQKRPKPESKLKTE